MRGSDRAGTPLHHHRAFREHRTQARTQTKVGPSIRTSIKRRRSQQDVIQTYAGPLEAILNEEMIHSRQVLGIEYVALKPLPNVGLASSRAKRRLLASTRSGFRILRATLSIDLQEGSLSILALTNNNGPRFASIDAFAT